MRGLVHAFKSRFSLFCLILDRFCFGLRPIQAPNKPVGCHSGSGTCRAKPSRTRTSRPIFRPGHLVPLFGSPRPIFYNGVEIINAIILCVKIYFLNLLLYKKRTFDQMHIGKFYHKSCNTVLCRLFNSVNLLCLFVCMYIHE